MEPDLCSSIIRGFLDSQDLPTLVGMEPNVPLNHREADPRGIPSNSYAEQLNEIQCDSNFGLIGEPRVSQVTAPNIEEINPTIGSFNENYGNVNCNVIDGIPKDITQLTQKANHGFNDNNNYIQPRAEEDQWVPPGQSMSNNDFSFLQSINDDSQMSDLSTNGFGSGIGQISQPNVVQYTPVHQPQKQPTIGTDKVKNLETELFEDFLNYISKENGGANDLFSNLAHSIYTKAVNNRQIDGNHSSSQMIDLSTRDKSSRSDNAIAPTKDLNNEDATITNTGLVSDIPNDIHEDQTFEDDSILEECSNDQNYQPEAKRPKTTNNNVIIPEYAESISSAKSVRSGRPIAGSAKLYQCPKCDKKVSTEGYLQQHMEAHRKDRKLFFKCEICDAEFKHLRNISRHVKEVHLMERPFKCSDCGRHFPDEPRLTAHVQERHSDYKIREVRKNMAPIVECKICHKTFNKDYFTRVHRLSHKGLKYACGLCGQAFNAEERLKVHFKQHETPGAFKFRCLRCQITFKSKLMLERHIAWKHGIDGESSLVKQMKTNAHGFECKICGELFRRKTQLKKHASEHPELQSEEVTESIEDESAENMDELKSVDGLSENSFHCKICNTGFSNFLQLKYHCDELHQGIGHSLIMEIPEAPPGETPAQSEAGDPKRDNKVLDPTVANRYRKRKGLKLKTFKPGTSKQKVTRTRRILYACAYCDAEFHFKVTLRKHEGLHRKNEVNAGEASTDDDTAQETVANYTKCTYCEALFKKKAMLKRHEALHKTQPSRNQKARGSPKNQNDTQTENELQRTMFHCTHTDCNAMFSEEVMLQRHTMLHKRNDEQNNCETTTENRKGVTKMECPKCEAVFRNKDMFQRHLALHSINTIILTADRSNGTSKRQRGNPKRNDVTQSQTDAEQLSDDDALLKCGHCEAVFKNAGMLQKHENLHMKAGDSTTRKRKISSERRRFPRTIHGKLSKNDNDFEPSPKNNGTKTNARNSKITKRTPTLNKSTTQKRATTRNANCEEPVQTTKGNITPTSKTSLQKGASSAHGYIGESTAQLRLHRTKPCFVQLDKLTRETIEEVNSVKSLSVASHSNPRKQENTRLDSIAQLQFHQPQTQGKSVTDEIHGEEITTGNATVAFTGQLQLHKPKPCFVQLDRLNMDAMSVESLRIPLQPTPVDVQYNRRERAPSTVDLNQNRHERAPTPVDGTHRQHGRAPTHRINSTELLPPQKENNTIAQKTFTSNDKNYKSAHFDNQSIQNNHRTDPCLRKGYTRSHSAPIQANQRLPLNTIRNIIQDENKTTKGQISQPQHVKHPQNTRYNLRNLPLPQEEIKDKRNYVQSWLNNQSNQSRKYQAPDALKNVRISPMKKERPVLIYAGSRSCSSEDSERSESMRRALQSAEKRFLRELHK